MPEFVHLHNHTHYSLLDAACTPEQLIKAALDDGQPALALTDHGVMFGCMEFYKKAKKKGLKPILGFEAYVANGSRFDQTAGKKETKKKNYFHLLLLAKDPGGYKNLMKLTTLGHLEGFYYKPRIDIELLEKYHEGIVACSGCINGVVNAHIVNKDYETAFKAAEYYKSLFGDDFYMELQNHELPEDADILRLAPKIARELGIKLVATNDVHYIKKEHAIPHNVYLNISKGQASDTNKIDIRELRYGTPEMYFKTTEEMKKLFRDLPEAIETTLEIAEKCNMTFDNKLFMPQFPIPENSTAKTLDDYLVELTYKGLTDIYGELSKEVDERAKYELDVIIKMGFAGYFLIVYDFIKAARKMNVRVGPGRGSAAGSIVAYALQITNVDPLKYGLLFERFLNPDRVSMPDIDVDFSDTGRASVIEYVKSKYGANSVAQIVTFGTLSTRAVLKDVGRVLGINHTDINAITSKIPVILGKVTPLKEALELPDMKSFKNSEDPQIKELIEFSLILEGFYRNKGTHAAGVVIAPGEVSDYAPLYVDSETKNGSSGGYATQYNMKDLESAGLIKMDFLGLKTLSIIDNTLEMIEKNYGEKIDIDKIDNDDEKTYDIFANGNTLAVFQFESSGMKEYLRQLKPKSIEEITAMNALYRPGPMGNIPDYIDRKFGKKEIEYLHPIMESSLNNTFGIIVYQEQVMQLARDIAGFSLGQADILRRAMGKKDVAVMEKQKPEFVAGALKNGLTKKKAEEIFDLIQKFADYGFNKSHSLAYSILAYQTAWLKAHYTAEFLAANMSSEMNDQDKIVQLMEDAKKSDITVLPPDVNKSVATFIAENNTILFGLAAIKNVGIPAVESIKKAREEKPFTSFFDFAARVDTRLINKRTLEALICAGSFDSMDAGHRSALFESIEPALEYARAIQAGGSMTMDSLFGGSAQVSFVEPKLPDVPVWSEKERLRKEKEFLNFYISGHPMDRLAPYINSLATLQLGDKDSPQIGNIVRVCGIISDIRTRLDRRQNTIAFIKLEDFTGHAECIFWSDAYANFNRYLRIDSIVMCSGKAESDGEQLKIIIDEVQPIDEAAVKFAKGYNIWVDLEHNDEKKILQLNKLCNDLYAKSTVIFNIFDKNTKYRQSYRVDNVSIPINERVVGALVDLFGKNNVRLLMYK